LIVDVRGNGGGNISQMLIERLRRQLLGTDFDRASDTASIRTSTWKTNPHP
jgi:C-terminal processing protease CtpA/Prc